MRKLIVAGAIWLCGFAAMAQPVQIAALGDSLTQGYGLVQGDGFVPQLADWLDQNGADAVLINAGVSGDTTAGGARRVDWTLTPDVDAMIVALGGNDLLRGIDPAESRANLRSILEAAQAKDVDVLLIGLIAPENYGADYKAEFDRIYPELADEYGTLYVENFLAAITDGQSRAEATRLMQDDAIHPNAEGVARIVALIGPAVLDLIARARPTER